MSKGDGEGGGRLSAGGVGGRAAGVAGMLAGGVVISGVGYLVVRHTGKGFVKLDPTKLTPQMAAAAVENAGKIAATDVLASTAKARVANAMRTEGGQLVTPVASGKQLKRALKLAEPTVGKYEELARKINLANVKGTGGREGRNLKARQRRIRGKLQEVLIDKLRKL